MSETPIADEVAAELGVAEDAVVTAPEDEAEADRSESGDETAAA